MDDDTNDGMGFDVGQALCATCKWSWVALVPTGDFEPTLQCPNCKSMSGHWMTEDEARPPSEEK